MGLDQAKAVKTIVLIPEARRIITDHGIRLRGLTKDTKDRDRVKIVGIEDNKRLATDKRFGETEGVRRAKRNILIGIGDREVGEETVGLTIIVLADEGIMRTNDKTELTVTGLEKMIKTVIEKRALLKGEHPLLTGIRKPPLVFCQDDPFDLSLHPASTAGGEDDGFGTR
jgi:hypothetical protein